VRVYIWHGYLLRGTGSNEYTRALARTLAGQGHDVTVFCQEHDRVDLGGARVVRPYLPGPLPVFVLDQYAHAEPALLSELSREDLDTFVHANAAAIRAQGPADLLITNHVLLGGPVGAASGLRYIVKAHGSELEYAMRGNPALCEWAAQTLAPAHAVIAGSEHVRRVVVDLVGVDPGVIEVIPPGVDTDMMRPRSRDEALAGLLAEADADEPPHGDPRLPDEGNAQRFAEFFARPGPVVVYVGKVSAEKGVPLLVEVLADLQMRGVVVGFGPARADLEAAVGQDILFTGALLHRHLQYLWPMASTSVVPSVFPEAFGMVAAEAASCGCPPLVAEHTGLAEIAAGLRRFYPGDMADLACFPRGDAPALADRITRLVTLPPARHDVLAGAAREAATSLWGWESVAERITALAARR
jgi:glycosyltransferase involved in cell wall biosynthesis